MEQYQVEPVTLIVDLRGTSHRPSDVTEFLMELLPKSLEHFGMYIKWYVTSSFAVALDAGSEPKTPVTSNHLIIGGYLHRPEMRSIVAWYADQLMAKFGREFVVILATDALMNLVIYPNKETPSN